MDIMRMHDMIETLTEVAKCEFDKGIENVNTEEMGKVMDIIKDLAEAEYYRKISVAMDEAEYGEDYDYEGRKYYRGQPRSKTSGRYMKRGDGRRMGYDEPWNEVFDYNELERMRDMDRPHGRMYYTDGTSGTSSMNSGSTSGSSSNGSAMGTRGYSEGSRYENSRRGYEEKKTMGADKQEKMKSLEEYMKTIAEELTQAVEGASPEERAMIKAKLNTVATKM